MKQLKTRNSNDWITMLSIDLKHLLFQAVKEFQNKDINADKLW